MKRPQATAAISEAAFKRHAKYSLYESVKQSVVDAPAPLFHILDGAGELSRTLGLAVAACTVTFGRPQPGNGRYLRSPFSVVSRFFVYGQAAVRLCV